MPPAFVQVNEDVNRNGTPVTSDSVTLGSPVTSGNAVLAWTLCTAATSITSFSDDKGNTYTIIDQRIPSGGLLIGVGIAFNLTNGPSVITANYGGALAGAARVVATEISGAASVDTFSFLLSSPGTGTDTISSGNLTTSNNNELIVGISNVGGTITAGTGYTIRDSDMVGNDDWTEDQVQATAGVIAATFSASAIHSGAMTYGVALVGAAPPPPPPPPPTLLPYIESWS